MSVRFRPDLMRLASVRKKTAAPFGGGAPSQSFNPATRGFSGGGGIPGTPGGGGRTQFNPVYDDLSEGTIIEQFMPVDPRRLHRIWRRIHLQDPVAGPALDLYTELPWSEFQLIGIDDPDILRMYADCLDAIGLPAVLPEISAEFLKMGKVIGHLHMDESKGYYTKLIIHDPDWIRVDPIPIPGFPPKLNIIPTPHHRRWAVSVDERDVVAHNEIRELVELIKSGKEIPLPPEQSFYLPRKTAPYDTIGASAYTRILMFVAYEKALINGTIAAAKRRLSRIRHIQVGLEDWEPSPQELDGISSLFMQADEDPVGAIVVTRTGVQASELGGGTIHDVVKISDEWQFLQSGKLNSLGVSEAFLRGEASYNALEQLMSVFLEKVRAHRNFMTHYLLIDKLLKPLAEKHGFVKRTTAELTHRVRIGRSSTHENLLLPDFKWEKSLRPVADRDYLEILEFMAGKGVPVTMRTWAASAGLNLETEMQQFEDDLEIRKQLSAHMKKIQEVAPETIGTSGGGGLGGLGGGMGPGLDLDTGAPGGGPPPDLDLGDLGGDMGDLGGGGSGGPPGVNNDLPGAGPSISLPTLGASFKGASALSDQDRDSIAALLELPHWARRDFLGVTKEHAELTARRLLADLGNNFSKAFGRQKLASIVDTGNVRKTQVLQYILARAGILHGITLSQDVASDITDKLMDVITNRGQLKRELSYVYAYTISRPEAPGAAVNSQIPLGFQNIVIPGERAGNRLLTGYVDNSKVIKDVK